MSASAFRPYRQGDKVITLDGVIMEFVSYKMDGRYATIMDDYGDTYTTLLETFQPWPQRDTQSL
jgi:hypothetical protein